MKKPVVALAVAALGAIAAFPAAADAVSSGYRVFAGKDIGRGFPLTPENYFNSVAAYNRFAGNTSPSLEGFESYSGGQVPSSITFEGPNGSVTADLTGGNGRVQTNQVLTPGSGQQFSGRFSVGPNEENTGTKFWEVEANDQENTFELSFSREVEAFGFFGVDVGDFNGSLFLDFLGGDGSVLFTVDSQAALGGSLPGGGSVLYLGVRATEANRYFQGVRFRTGASLLAQSAQSSSTQDNPGSTRVDLFAFDSFSVVAAPGGTQPPAGVPAPGTLALLGTALAGLALMRRRA